MMKSMTGYASAEESASGLEIEVSLKAVNGRFFEPRFHMPRVYQPYESTLKKTLLKYIRRGTVDIYVHRRAEAGVGKNQVKMREALAQEWAKELRSLGKKLNMSGELDINHLLKWPDVATLEDVKKVSQREQSLLSKAVEKAALKLDKERLREGRALKKDLQSHLKSLNAYIVKMKALREEANAALRVRFEQRLARLTEEKIDPNRLAQEVAIQIDRSDISEEIIRLGEHFKSCGKLVAAPEVYGKKLEFYCQEFLREVNTIGSKTQLVQLTELVVESKTIIEKFREQVQNIE